MQGHSGSAVDSARGKYIKVDVPIVSHLEIVMGS